MSRLPNCCSMPAASGCPPGLSITLGLGLIGLLQPSVFWTLVIAGNLLAVWCWRKEITAPTASEQSEPTSRLLIALTLLVCVSMIWAMLLGAATPQTDFDVVEYHLNGPKEWFQRGRIEFLPHNVYTSFPFLTEMLVLSGMVLRNDWHAGALAGKVVLMAFAPLTALGLYVAGRRWFSEAAGWLAALIWLTTPWTYRISIIAYAEGGLSFYLLATFLAAHRACTSPDVTPRRFLLPGFLAGSAMACKYPGLVSVIVPIGLGSAAALWLRRCPGLAILQGRVVFLLGVLIAVGPWLAKNWCETGNPVYPLLYSVFGGESFDAATNARWVKAHGPPDYGSLSGWLKDFVRKLTDVVANNDWHSPLLYGLAPLSLLWRNRRREVLSAWLLTGWLFVTWFVLTHHIDRFWVPMISIVALLAGAGAAWLMKTRLGLIVGGSVIAACIGFNVAISSLFGGYNAGLTDLRFAERIAEQSLTPELAWLDEEYAADRLPPDFKLLCVGEAATFHARFPLEYNTVFDDCLLEEWCAAGGGPEFPLQSEVQIRETLKRHGITHVFVNWREILRYREPGSYGYTDFVHPKRIRELQRMGVLGPERRLPNAVGLAPLTEQRRDQLEAWAPELIVLRGNDAAYVSGQIFPVR